MAFCVVPCWLCQLLLHATKVLIKQFVEFRVNCKQVKQAVTVSAQLSSRLWDERQRSKLKITKGWKVKCRNGRPVATTSKSTAMPSYLHGTHILKLVHLQRATFSGIVIQCYVA